MSMYAANTGMLFFPCLCSGGLTVCSKAEKKLSWKKCDFSGKRLVLQTLIPMVYATHRGYVFYNTSDFTLKQLVSTATNNRQILEANFKAYLDGFSDNVKEIIDRFELRNQISHMVEHDILLDVLEKFVSERINLSPEQIRDPDGRILPPLKNLGMGYVFEELIRKFNEENNEEAGEHFTPREVIQLMTHILFEPIKDQIPPVITILRWCLWLWRDAH